MTRKAIVVPVLACSEKKKVMELERAEEGQTRKGFLEQPRHFAVCSLQ